MNISDPGRDPVQFPAVRGPESSPPLTPSQAPRPRPRTPADLAALQQLTPEQAAADLDQLFDSAATGLVALKPGATALPENLPRQMSQQPLVHQRVLDDQGEEWVETRWGDFRQLSREDGEWTELVGEDGSWTRQRQCLDPDDGLGPWTEVESSTQHYKVRYLVEEGCTWCEIWRGERYQKILVRRHDVHHPPA